MPYIRTRGNQLLLVHGFRDELGKVNQQILFTIFTKPEALEAIGEIKHGGNPDYFKFLLEAKFPLLKFNWPKLTKAIKDQMSVLPDFYEYKQERVQNYFKKDMTGFLRQLLSTDPRSTLLSAQMYQDNRYVLEFITELIENRLFCAKDAKSNEYNGDNPFYWRQSIKTSCPYEAEEMATLHLDKGDHDRAEAIFKLLTESYEDYAEGHNYLGIIAMDKGNLELAVHYFKETVSVGRKKFPKKISKKRYWSDHSTRPYMRGLRNLSLVLNRLGRFDEALEICNQLEHECGDILAVASTYSDIYLNKGQWELAFRKAKYCNNIWPCTSFNGAFALLEMGDDKNAKKYFLHGALNYPYTAHALIGTNRKDLKKYETLAIDVKDDIEMSHDMKENIFKYFADSHRKIKNSFGNWLNTREIQNLIFERVEAMNKWKTKRKAGTSESYDKMTEMGKLNFAEKVIYT